MSAGSEQLILVLVVQIKKKNNTKVGIRHENGFAKPGSPLETAFYYATSGRFSNETFLK